MPNIVNSISKRPLTMDILAFPFALLGLNLSVLKTHHYITCFVRPLQAGNGELFLIKYRSIIIVGLCYYNQSGVTELLIMKNPHYVRMCFKSVKTLGALHS